MTEPQFRDHLFRTIPHLCDAVDAKQHLRVTSLLCAYVHSNHVWSNDGLMLNQYCDGNLWALSAPQIAFLFTCREIGVLCGGLATFFVKVLNLFGYDAATFFYGIKNIATHVTTLVSITEETRHVIVIQDPTFNMTYSLKSTGGRSVFDILRAIVQANHDDIVIEKGKTQPRKIYFGRNKNAYEALQYYRDNNVLIEKPKTERTLLTNRTIGVARGDLDFHTSYLRRRQATVIDAVSGQMNRPHGNYHVLDLMLFPFELPVFQTRDIQAKVKVEFEKLLQQHAA
jgi:hypothetical protein